MLDLARIHAPTAALLAEQLDQVVVVFERQLASELSAVNALTVHVERYRGKMLRPTLLLLSGLATTEPAGDANGLTETHRIIAAVTEMIHMATLVHDDVLDEAEVRRRGATVNHLWGNETAVMLGDFLISNAFHLCSTAGDPAINLALGQVTNTLCEGELVQLHHRNDYGLDEDTYFEIVSRKTASLIGACARLGGTISGAPNDVVEALGRFGERLGVAFQIQDDLLDITGDQAVVGKTLGLDLDKGKLTLPMIDLLSNAAPPVRGSVLSMIEQRDAAGLLDAMTSSGAIERTTATARRLVDEARVELDHLAPSPARDLLEVMANTVVDRSA